MTVRRELVLVFLFLAPPIASCSTLSEEARAARKMEVKITPDDTTSPRRIRFDLYRTPYADIQDQKLPVHEQIRLGMRRFAAERLAELGYCQIGFTGPDAVWVSERDRQHSFFYVECVQLPDRGNKEIKGQ